MVLDPQRRHNRLALYAVGAIIGTGMINAIAAGSYRFGAAWSLGFGIVIVLAWVAFLRARFPNARGGEK